MLAQYAKEAKGVEDAAKERRELEGRMGWLKEQYEWGDITRAEYTAKRDQIRERLRVLAPESTRRKDVSRLVERVTLLRDTWKAASQEERNKIAGELLQKVVIKGRSGRGNRSPTRPCDDPSRVESLINLVRKRRDSNPRSQP